MPLPMKSAAKRFGNLVVPTALSSTGVSAPQTRTDSSHGNAMVTPTPRRNVRRDSFQVLLFIRLVPRQIRLRPRIQKLRARDDAFDEHAEAMIARSELRFHLSHERFITQNECSAEAISEQLA